MECMPRLLYMWLLIKLHIEGIIAIPVLIQKNGFANTFSILSIHPNFVKCGRPFVLYGLIWVYPGTYSFCMV